MREGEFWGVGSDLEVSWLSGSAQGSGLGG